MKGLDVTFKVVVMISAMVAIGTFFFTFEHKTDARNTYAAIHHRIDKTEDRFESQQKELRGQLIRMDNKIDEIKTILIRRR